MKILNAKTKRARHMMQVHEEATTKYLHQLYRNPSDSKIIAYYDCVDLCAEMGGYDFKVHSANIYSFSASFKTDDGLVYITRNGEFLIC